MAIKDTYKVAVLIPCYNEERTIANVVHGFRMQLPDSDIHVFDNNSTDNTAREASKAGAIIHSEHRQGKGNVVRSMFRHVEADIYVMVDGDGTYPHDKVHEIIHPIAEGEVDMVIGSRLHTESASRFHLLNHAGNIVFRFLLNTLFRVNITDLLSGYRAFSSRVVKSLPVLSRGFEIETELTVKCIERDYSIHEIPVNLVARPQGSKSKIKIIRDGFLILKTIFALFRDYKPMTAFGLIGIYLALSGFLLGMFIIAEFIVSQYVTHIPLVILSVGLVLSGLLSICAGMILHAQARHFQEIDYQLQNLSEMLNKNNNSQLNLRTAQTVQPFHDGKIQDSYHQSRLSRISQD
jgi:glycosyltransferase involved in cell wall biosynthesis